MLRQRGPRNPDEVPESREGHSRGRVVIPESEREGEELPLAVGERGQRLPRPRRCTADGPEPRPPVEPVEELAELREDGVGNEEGQPCASRVLADDLEGDDPSTRGESLLEGLGDLPFNPRDVLPAFSVRKHYLEPHEPIPPDERAGLAADRIEVLERSATMDADDDCKDLRSHRERLEDIKGLVVPEEPLAQDPEVLEEGDRHDEVEPLHENRLTGKPFAAYSPAPSCPIEEVRPMAQKEEKPFTAETSVITCNMEGIVQQYAADAADLFGWRPDEVIGKMSVAAFHVPENVPTLVPRLLREAVENGKFEEEVTLVRKDGGRFPAILTVRPMFQDGAQVGYMGKTRPLAPPTKP